LRPIQAKKRSTTQRRGNPTAHHVEDGVDDLS